MALPIAFSCRWQFALPPARSRAAAIAANTSYVVRLVASVASTAVTVAALERTPRSSLQCRPTRWRSSSISRRECVSPSRRYRYEAAWRVVVDAGVGLGAELEEHPPSASAEMAATMRVKVRFMARDVPTTNRPFGGFRLQFAPLGREAGRLASWRLPSQCWRTRRMWLLRSCPACAVCWVWSLLALRLSCWAAAGGWPVRCRRSGRRRSSSRPDLRRGNAPRI